MGWPHNALVKLSLEDLRKQRELLALQVELLDRYMADLAAAGAPPVSQPAVPTVPPGPTAPPSAAEVARPLSSSTASIPPAKPLAPPVTPAMAQAGLAPQVETPVAAMPDEVFLGAPSSGLSDREKYGCIALVVVICLAFLGFLFGPYLWEILSHQLFAPPKDLP